MDQFPWKNRRKTYKLTLWYIKGNVYKIVFGVYVHFKVSLHISNNLFCRCQRSELLIQPLAAPLSIAWALLNGQHHTCLISTRSMQYCTANHLHTIRIFPGCHSSLNSKFTSEEVTTQMKLSLVCWINLVQSVRKQIVTRTRLSFESCYWCIPLKCSCLCTGKMCGFTQSVQ